MLHLAREGRGLFVSWGIDCWCLGPGMSVCPFTCFPTLISGFLPSPLLKTQQSRKYYVHTGANVNAKDTLWLTPLHRAAASRNEVWTDPTS